MGAANVLKLLVMQNILTDYNWIGFNNASYNKGEHKAHILVEFSSTMWGGGRYNRYVGLIGHKLNMSQKYKTSINKNLYTQAMLRI